MNADAASLEVAARERDFCLEHAAPRALDFVRTFVDPPLRLELRDRIRQPAGLNVREAEHQMLRHLDDLPRIVRLAREKFA